MINRAIARFFLWKKLAYCLQLYEALRRGFYTFIALRTLPKI